VDVEAHVLRLNGDRRKVLDEWFPTVVRYLGVLILMWEVMVDRGKNPAMITAAMGMILFKSLVGGKNGDGS
jgi:hypothetical protein